MFKRLITNLVAMLCVVSIVQPIKEVRAEVIQNATHKIETFTTEHFDGSENGVWNTASTDNANHLFAYRTSLAVSGEKSLEKGSVNITVPKSILKLRDGTQGDTLQMSIPSKEEVEKAIKDGETVDSKWQYEIKNDKVVISNIEEIPSGSNNYIEYGYKTIKQPSFYRDMELSKNVVADVTIKTPSGELNTTSQADGVKINTNVAITELRNRISNGDVLQEWNSAWGAKPSDTDDYYYTMWTVDSKVAGNQPYNLTMNVTASSDVGKPVEVVKYNISNSGWSDSNVDSNSSIFNNADNYRYAYYITRIKKADFDSFQHYNLYTTVTEIVHPIDGIDSDTSLVADANAEYHKPEFEFPTGHFYHIEHGDGWYRKNKNYNLKNWKDVDVTLGQYSRYDLEKFQNGDLSEYDSFDFGLSTYGYPTPWTIHKGDNTTNPDNYHKEKVTYIQENYGIKLSANDGTVLDTKLTSDDYEIKSISIKKTVHQPKFNNISKVFRGVSSQPTDEDDVDVYVKYNSLDNQWEKIGVFSPKDGEYKNLANGYSSDGRKLTLNKNVVAYKLVTSDSNYYSSLDTGVQLALKHSNTIDEFIKDKKDITVSGYSKGYVKDYTGDTIYELEQQDYDYARQTKLDSNIRKEVKAVSNNRVNKTYTLTWGISVSETMQSGSDDVHEDVEQRGGTFYDLLPNGMSYVDGSISLKNEGTDEELSYTVETTPNFRGTGRTLLKVSTSETIRRATLYFNTTLDYKSIADYGKKIYNPVAFETGDKQIANGKPNNGDGLEEYKNVFKNISNSTGNKFIYAQDRYSIQALFAGSAGLIKQVKDKNDLRYSYSTITNTDGDYSYRLRFENSMNTFARDIVLFDSIENFVTSDNKESAWRGILQSIDTTQLEKIGIKPQVYVNTIEKYDLETQRGKTADEMLANNWTKLEDFTGDYSTIKSVAIDCRKKQDGSDFVLGKGKSVSAVLNMKAPSYVQANGKQLYTYNNVYAHNTIVDENGGSKTFYIHQDYTEVKYSIVGKLKIHKTSSKDGSAISNVEFSIYGTSEYGDSVDRKGITDKDGNIAFSKIPHGRYTLVESKTTPDFLQKDHKYELVIDEHGKAIVDGVETDILNVTNDPRIHADFSFYKKSTKNKDGLQFPIPDTTFSLIGTSDYGNKVAESSTSGEDGVITFKNVEKGTYVLTETKANKDYKLSKEIYEVKIDELSEVSITHKGTGKVVEDKIITNQKILNLVEFKKVDKETNKPLSGAEFNIYGTANDGSTVSIDSKSGDDGIVKFNIKSGIYQIKETKAPVDGNIKYDTWVVDKILVVNEDGTYEIKNEKKDSNDMYVLTNEKALGGTITITKVWEGGNRGNKIPKIRLTDTEEVFKDGKVN